MASMFFCGGAGGTSVVPDTPGVTNASPPPPSGAPAQEAGPSSSMPSSSMPSAMPSSPPPFLLKSPMPLESAKLCPPRRKAKGGPWGVCSVPGVAKSAAAAVVTGWWVVRVGWLLVVVTMGVAKLEGEGWGWEGGSWGWPA
eukprot:scaffold259561_cov19-Tisochrysis_lutea.AAC.2